MAVPDLIPPNQIADWTWSNLQQATDRPSHPFHLLVLATVSPDGRPAARVMTNRGADRARGLLWLYTRMPTPKTTDLRAHPSVCLVGYDPAQGVQVRLSGSASLHSSSDIADRHWDHVTQVSKWLLRLPPEQSAAAVGIDPRLPAGSREGLEENLTARERAHFGVIEIILDTIDWHQATSARQLRAVLHAHTRWHATPLT